MLGKHELIRRVFKSGIMLDNIILSIMPKNSRSHAVDWGQRVQSRYRCSWRCIVLSMQCSSFTKQRYVQYPANLSLPFFLIKIMISPILFLNIFITSISFSPRVFVSCNDIKPSVICVTMSRYGNPTNKVSRWKRRALAQESSSPSSILEICHSFSFYRNWPRPIRLGKYLPQKKGY